MGESWNIGLMVNIFAGLARGIMEHDIIKQFYADDLKRKPNGTAKKNHKVSVITGKKSGDSKMEVKKGGKS